MYAPPSPRTKSITAILDTSLIVYSYLTLSSWLSNAATPSAHAVPVDCLTVHHCYTQWWCHHVPYYHSLATARSCSSIHSSAQQVHLWLTTTLFLYTCTSCKGAQHNQTQLVCHLYIRKNTCEISTKSTKNLPRKTPKHPQAMPQHLTNRHPCQAHFLEILLPPLGIQGSPIVMEVTHIPSTTPHQKRKKGPFTTKDYIVSGFVGHHWVAHLLEIWLPCFRVEVSLIFPEESSGTKIDCLRFTTFSIFTRTWSSQVPSIRI